MGEVGDPNITASIAIDDVSFGNKTCEKLPKGKFKLIFAWVFAMDSSKNVSIAFLYYCSGNDNR